MLRIDARLERALLAVAAAAGTALLLTVGNGEPILSGELLPIVGAVGVAVYAGGCSNCSGAVGEPAMTNWEPVSWTLGVLAIVTTVAGAYLTGTSGGLHALLIVGVGATTTWLVLHEELIESVGEDESGPEGSA